MSVRPLQDLSARLAVVEVSGGDSGRFLQAQLSCDIARIGDEGACYGAYLSPKGRVLATVFVVPADRGFWLLMHPSLVDLVVARLRLYVLRDDVTLAPAPGLSVSGAGRSQSGDAAPDLSLLPLTRNDNGCRIRLPDGRELVVSNTPGEQPADDWWRDDVEQGIASIEQATSDRHIAQALGLDRIGAVSFSKGCFPGQEIVARVHYLGRAKRGLVLVSGRKEPAPGDELLDEAGKRAGEIVSCAADPAGESLALAVVNEGATQLQAGDEPLTLIRQF